MTIRQTNHITWKSLKISSKIAQKSMGKLHIKVSHNISQSHLLPHTPVCLLAMLQTCRPEPFLFSCTVFAHLLESTEFITKVYGYDIANHHCNKGLSSEATLIAVLNRGDYVYRQIILVQHRKLANYRKSCHGYWHSIAKS